MGLAPGSPASMGSGSTQADTLATPTYAGESIELAGAEAVRKPNRACGSNAQTRIDCWFTGRSHYYQAQG